MCTDNVYGSRCDIFRESLNACVQHGAGFYFSYAPDIIATVYCNDNWRLALQCLWAEMYFS